MERKSIIGYYTKYGYKVMLLIDGQVTEQLYSAGNSALDSQSYVLPDEGLPLATIKEYCEQTTKEISDEHPEIEYYDGIEHDEDDEKYLDDMYNYDL